MMKNIFVGLMLLCIALTTNAQDTVKKAAVRRYTIDQSSVVKDSTGKVLTFTQWSALTRTKEYVLVPEDFNHMDNKFVLVKQGGGALSRYLNHRISNAPMDKPVNNEPVTASPPPADPYERMSNWPKPVESEYFKTGGQIKLFSTHDINGNKLSLKELRGKVVVLNFWFIGCPACMQEIPELNEISAKYKDNPNVVFIAIALDFKSDIRKFLATTPFNYQVVNEGGIYAKEYGITLYPTNLIIDKEGKVALHWVGYAPGAPYWMRKTIDESLK